MPSTDKHAIGCSWCAVGAVVVLVAASARVQYFQPQWVGRPGLPRASWDGQISFHASTRVVSATVAEASRVLEAAGAAGLRVKVLGSGHSWSPAADPEGGVALSLDGLDSFEVLSTFRGGGVVRAGGGIRLVDLFARLDERGLALPNVPSVNAQSLGGVLATACHGSGAASQGMASAVEAVGLLSLASNGSAVQLTAKKADLDAWRALVGDATDVWGPTALAAAQEANPDAAAIRERALRFDAARAHMGAMGIVLWAELRCVDAFWLESTEWLEATDAIFAASPGPAPATREPPAWASARAFHDECIGAPEGVPSPECASREVDAGVAPASLPSRRGDDGCVTLPCLSRRFEFLKLWVIPHTGLTVVHGIRRLPGNASRVSSGSSGLRRLVDEVQADILDGLMAAGAVAPSLQPLLNGIASLSFALERRRVAPAHALQVIPFRVPFHTETEWSVPARHASRLFRAFTDGFEAAGARSGFVQEWRLVAPDDVLASPDQEDADGTAEPRVHVTLGLRDPAAWGFSETYFGAMERAAAPLGGRPHWAKRIGTSNLSYTHAALAALYPPGRLAALREAAEAADPLGVFRNTWSDTVTGRAA